jgi:hypothetical protein
MILPRTEVSMKSGEGQVSIDYSALMSVIKKQYKLWMAPEVFFTGLCRIPHLGDIFKR